MKNLKLLFVAALFCGFALNSNAQSDTRKFENTWEIWFNCEGVVDMVSGTMHGHVVDHFNPKTGVFEWYKFTFFSDDFVSMNTGEVFSVRYSQGGKTDGDFNLGLNNDGSIYTTTRFNLRGNEGSHILVTVIWFKDGPTGTWTRIKRTVKCL